MTSLYSAPYESGERAAGGAIHGAAPRQCSDNKCGAPPPYTCMYTVQGDLACGLKRKTHPFPLGFGDPRAVQCARLPLGFVDPYGVEDAVAMSQTPAASDRRRDCSACRRWPYDGYAGPGLYDANGFKPGVDVKPMPCCRRHCMQIGPCDDPTAIVTRPDSTCALCQSGLCNGYC